MTPTDSQLKIITNVTKRHIEGSMSPLEAFDRAKRDLRSAIDIDWDLVRFDHLTMEVTQVVTEPSISKDWASGTMFMLPGQFPHE